MRESKKRTAIALWFLGLLGFLNLHNFYIGKKWIGTAKLALYIVTLAYLKHSTFQTPALGLLAGLAIWNIVDLVRIMKLSPTESERTGPASGQNAMPIEGTRPAQSSGSQPNITDKGLHTTNIFANLFLKLCMLLMIVGVCLGVVAFSLKYKAPEDTRSYIVYINGIRAGISTPESRINFSDGFGLLGLAFGVVTGIAILVHLLRTKYLINFEAGGGMRGASRKRVRVLWLAALFGYAGIDSFLLRRGVVGAVRLALFVCLVLLLRAEPSREGLAGILVLAPIVLFTWLWGVMKILSGTASIGYGKDDVWDSGNYLK